MSTTTEPQSGNGPQDRSDAAIISFFLENAERDDAEEMTCRRYGITEDTLNYILASDLHARMS